MHAGVGLREVSLVQFAMDRGHAIIEGQLSITRQFDLVNHEEDSISCWKIYTICIFFRGRAKAAAKKKKTKKTQQSTTSVALGMLAFEKVQS